MAGEPCEVTDCDTPTRGPSGLCKRHQARLHVYGSAEDWDPIPKYRAPGTTDDHLAMLVDLRRHGRLTGYCEAVLRASSSERLRRMPDSAFWALFRRYFPG